MTNMRSAIRNINKAIYSWWMDLPARNEKYTNPYLIRPSTTFVEGKRKIVVLGKETNGWCQSEQEDERNISGEDIVWSVERLEDFYDKKVNGNAIEHNPFWSFCWDLEGAIVDADSNIGFCYANVALLGKLYGERGYDMSLAEILSRFLGKYIDAIKPDAILCLTGFGTKTRRELPYLKILEQKELFGKYDRDNDMIVGNADMKYPLKRLAFENAPCPIFGTAHPERNSREWKEDMIKSMVHALEYW